MDRRIRQSGSPAIGPARPPERRFSVSRFRIESGRIGEVRRRVPGSQSDRQRRCSDAGPVSSRQSCMYPIYRRRAQKPRMRRRRGFPVCANECPNASELPAKRREAESSNAPVANLAASGFPPCFVRHNHGPCGAMEGRWTTGCRTGYADGCRNDPELPQNVGRQDSQTLRSRILSRRVFRRASSVIIKSLARRWRRRWTVGSRMGYADGYRNDPEQPAKRLKPEE